MNKIMIEKLNEFPTEVIANVKDTLTCHDRCNIRYENDRYTVTTGLLITNSNSVVEVTYFEANDFYTKEERAEHRAALSECDWSMMV